MSRGKQIIRILFSLLVLGSFGSNVLVVRATDLVPSDDLTNGASVFVFRDSRKKPQDRAGGAAAFKAHASGTVARRERLKTQMAGVKQKKAAQTKSRQAELAKDSSPRTKRAVKAFKHAYSQGRSNDGQRRYHRCDDQLPRGFEGQPQECRRDGRTERSPDRQGR